MGFGLRPRFLIHILVISLTASSIINVAQGQSTADEYLTPHNDARAGLNEDIPSLTWDTTLESYATDWAATRAAAGDDCALIHSGGPYGKNIYWSSGPSTPADAVQAWVSEEAYYDYATDSCSAPEGESCGHYTQVVWRDTAALGCGSATCPSGALFVVCSYDPPGNVVGQLPY
ncbi:pathogenesis-related protein 1 [Marchantia polymorpha subsp. ruderalis]